MICIGLQLFVESPVYNNTEIGPIRIGSCNDFSGLGGCGAYSTMVMPLYAENGHHIELN